MCLERYGDTNNIGERIGKKPPDGMDGCTQDDRNDYEKT
jgi:hypothetical protein